MAISTNILLVWYLLIFFGLQFNTYTNASFNDAVSINGTITTAEIFHPDFEKSLKEIENKSKEKNPQISAKGSADIDKGTEITNKTTGTSSNCNSNNEEPSKKIPNSGCVDKNSNLESVDTVSFSENFKNGISPDVQRNNENNID